jgi:hypothetical protein
MKIQKIVMLGTLIFGIAIQTQGEKSGTQYGSNCEGA